MNDDRFDVKSALSEVSKAQIAARYVLPADAAEERACREHFQSLGFAASMTRTVQNDGTMVWQLTVHTGRGQLVATWGGDACAWREEAAEWGLGESADSRSDRQRQIDRERRQP